VTRTYVGAIPNFGAPIVSVETGGVVSRTVTWKDFVPTFPWESAAEQLTRVVPRGNVEPDAGVHETGTVPSTMSVADALKETALPAGETASTTTSAGTVRLGGVLSTTVIVKDAEPVFPWASVATQVTVVVPNPNVEPDAGAHETPTEPSTMSVAVDTNVAIAPLGPVASIIRFGGTVTTGGVVSTTRIVNVAEPVLPCASVAEHPTVVTPSGNVDPEEGAHVGVREPSTRSEADET